MRLFLTGATGLIGRRLVLDRLERGDQVVILSRDHARATNLFAADANPNVRVVEGNPATPGRWQHAVDGCEAVIHLAGVNVADRRWDAAYKQAIRNSRIDGTHQVVEAIAAARQRPNVLISASAIGWYGDTGEREVDETALAARSDFFGDLAVAWERAAEKARELNVRVVPLRIGLVLDRRGGLLPRLVPPFRWYAGGPIGNGRQFMAWIHWRDLVGLIDHALRDPMLHGPLNATAPDPVRNRDFSRELGRTLGRPSWLPVPRFALRIALGEFAKYACMSQRILPAKAEAFGYRFVYPKLPAALAELLSQSAAEAPSVAARARRLSRLDVGMSDRGMSASAPRVQSEGSSVAAAPESAVRVLAIAVDGIIHDRCRAPAELIEACTAARRSGVVIVLATAGPPRAIEPIRRALDLSAPAICYNGALIWNPIEQRAQFHEPLPADVARAITAAARAIAPDIFVDVEVLDRWSTDRVDPSLKAKGSPAAEPDGIAPLDELLASPLTQLNLRGTPTSIATIRPAIDERFWRSRSISLFQPDPGLVQIGHPMADKGIALQRIAGRLGIESPSVLAIGSRLSDTGMMGWSGLAVTVADAPRRVQDVAREVVPGGVSDAVSRSVWRYLLPLRATSVETGHQRLGQTAEQR